MAYAKLTLADCFSNSVTLTTWDDGSIFLRICGNEVLLSPEASDTFRAFLDILPEDTAA